MTILCINSHCLGCSAFSFMWTLLHLDDFSSFFTLVRVFSSNLCLIHRSHGQSVYSVVFVGFSFPYKIVFEIKPRNQRSEVLVPKTLIYYSTQASGRSSGKLSHDFDHNSQILVRTNHAMFNYSLLYECALVLSPFTVLLKNIARIEKGSPFFIERSQ